MKQNIRIVIADDHPLMRQGLKQVIEAEPGLTVVGEAAKRQTATRLWQRSRL